ncbi:hypothetical protein KP509_32G025400 [Ceratopteris richardii]|uniref:Uncharacterized protein n=1 Tax=Ceratopteris richardii TaxID=49495 RepID=A0A8T2QRS7_CERRI|nr:hypothetical protein KP509_32G025400 [Ceratopteris richardii]
MVSRMYFSTTQIIMSSSYGCDIKRIVSARSDELQSIASDSVSPYTWVQSNIVPYASSINILWAIRSLRGMPNISNIQNAIHAAGLNGSVRDSTPNPMDVTETYKAIPPSSAAFSTSIDAHVNFVRSFLFMIVPCKIISLLLAYIEGWRSTSLAYVTDSGSDCANTISFFPIDNLPL